MRTIFTIPHNRHRGMTLVELMVVLAIFAVVTSLTIFDYGSFRTSVSMQNITNDIALSIRKAQSYAIGAYGSNANFSYGYGMHFSTVKVPVTNFQSGSNKSFVLFTDVSGDKKYTYDNTNVCGTPSATNECAELLTITTADEISNIYLNESVTPVPTGGALDIYFVRPNPTAVLCYMPSGSSVCDNSTPLSHVKIEVSNGQTDATRKTRLISVWTTGQISTQ